MIYRININSRNSNDKASDKNYFFDWSLIQDGEYNVYFEFMMNANPNRIITDSNIMYINLGSDAIFPNSQNQFSTLLYDKSKFHLNYLKCTSNDNNKLYINRYNGNNINVVIPNIPNNGQDYMLLIILKSI